MYYPNAYYWYGSSPNPYYDYRYVSHRPIGGLPSISIPPVTQWPTPTLPSLPPEWGVSIPPPSQWIPGQGGGGPSIPSPGQVITGAGEGIEGAFDSVSTPHLPSLPPEWGVSIPPPSQWIPGQGGGGPSIPSPGQVITGAGEGIEGAFESVGTPHLPSLPPEWGVSIPPLSEVSTTGWPTLPSGSQPDETIPEVPAPPIPQGSWSQKKYNNIVIGLMSGAFGSGTLGNRAMKDFRKFLENYLWGRVKPENIFYQEWNPGDNDNPFAQPGTIIHFNKVNSISTDPCYLALIGYSYGGWGVSRLSREIYYRTGRTADFIALIDPVFGPRNVLQGNDPPIGKVKRNYFQNYAISEWESCSQARIPCTNAKDGIACGNSEVPGVEPIYVEHRRDWNGNRVRKHCMSHGRKAVRSTHANICWNNWVWRQIAEKLVQDIDSIQC